MPVALSQILSVFLALAVVYYVLGLIVSSITHYVLGVLETRGKTLEDFLKRNLVGMIESGKEKGKSLKLDELKQMPQLNTLKPVRYAWAGLGFFTGKTRISDVIERVPAKNLVDALFDLKGSINDVKDRANAIVDWLPDFLPGFPEPVKFTAKEKLKEVVSKETATLEELRASMESWFNGLMDQAAQEFRAKARWWVVLVSFIVTIALGVDSIELAQKYWKNAAISAIADAQAALILGKTDQQNQDNADAKALIKQLDEMKSVDLSWYKKPTDPIEAKDWSFLDIFLKKLPGMFITALAVSQGSSFWYDMIRRLKGEQSSTGQTGQGTTMLPDGTPVDIMPRRGK